MTELGFDMRIVSEKLPSTLDKRCGTYAGVRAHQKRKENLCDKCREPARLAWQKCRKKNAIRIKESNKNYYLANREKWREYGKAYYRTNLEVSRARSSQWYAENSNRKAVNSKAWNSANPEKRKTHNRTRRARKFAVPSEPYTTQDILNLWGTDCHNCGEAIDLNAPRTTRFKGWERGLQLDHVIPLSKGGSDLIENVKPSHCLCNLIKYNRVA